MTATEVNEVLITADGLPVFHGLEESNVTGKEIAAMVGVTPPTVSKWRRGRARIPAAKVAFLTMLLASWLDELEELSRVESYMKGETPSWLEAQLAEARRCLAEQERFNARLPASAVREGGRMFRDWWRSNAGRLGLAAQAGAAARRAVA